MTYSCLVLTPWKRIPTGNEMQVNIDYPADWSDQTGQVDDFILRGSDLLVSAGNRLTDAQMTALLADARYVVLRHHKDGEAPSDSTLTPSEVDAVRTKLTTFYAPDVAKLVTAGLADRDVIAESVARATRYEPWRAGIDVTAGHVYQYAGNLYEVIQAHTTQSDWTPAVARSLFKRFYEPTDDPWPFVQPTGGHDAYPVGARVTYGGFTWESLVTANVWVPGSVGAEALWRNLTPPPATSEWVSGEQGIQPGDKRTYQGVTYECIQNPGVNIWPPPAVQALWRAL